MSSHASIRELKRLVCGSSLAVRTGIVLVAQAHVGAEADASARVGLSVVNMPKWWLKRVEANAKYVDIRPQSIVDSLERVCKEGGADRCLGVLGFDLLIAGLKASERPQVWRVLRVGFRKRSKGLLFFIPSKARDLLPQPEVLKGWKQDGRVADL